MVVCEVMILGILVLLVNPSSLFDTSTSKSSCDGVTSRDRFQLQHTQYLVISSTMTSNTMMEMGILTHKTVSVFETTKGSDVGIGDTDIVVDASVKVTIGLLVNVETISCVVDPLVVLYVVTGICAVVVVVVVMAVVVVV